MLEIIPAIMPKTFDELREKSASVYRHVKTIHVDVMNGSMTPSVNWPFLEGGLLDIDKITKGELSLPYWKEVDYEVDIMMQDPEESLTDWVNAGFHRVIVHIENTQKLSAIIKEWKGIVEIGVAVGVETPNEEVYKYVEEGIDFIQFMGIYQIGYQGNPLDSRVYEKVKKAREAYPDLPISVDGSVNLETAPLLIKAGANRLVIGSALSKKITSSGVEIATFDIMKSVEITNLDDTDFTETVDLKKNIEEFKKLGV